MLFLLSVQKLVSKELKTRYFAYSACQWGDRHVARNSQWGGAVLGVWGRSPQPPEANGGLGAKPPTAGGLGAKPPAVGGTGVWGRSPQRSRSLRFFSKITKFWGYFDKKNNAFKTWLRNWQCKHD